MRRLNLSSSIITYVSPFGKSRVLAVPAGIVD